MPDFCHLHCHTQYSLLDGAARIERLVERAGTLGFSALGITDHGNLYGLPEFWLAADSRKIKPILGCEFYITPSGLGERSDRTRFHQVVWAKNAIGYHNLIKLSTKSFVEGYYYKPRIDRATLAHFSEGLVATTCCLQGEVPQAILHRSEAQAREIFEQYLDVFGEDYYIELQDHGIADQKRVNQVLVRWAREYGVKVIATNDVHYVDRTDAEAHDVLLCIQTKKDYNDPGRMRFEGDQFYLKSADEMRVALADIEAPLVDQALDHTLEIADKCTFELKKVDLLMPRFPIPDGFGDDMDAYLKHLVFQRANERYPSLSTDLEARLRFELDVIREKRFAGYFLVVQDFTTVARQLGVRVGPGRGSAAGSAVAYCLGITNVEPTRYGLLFERFLNPERESPPDIDIDFDDRGRSRVIDYVVQKYGRESVCQIVTYGTMGARLAIRDVARVLGLPASEADRVAGLIPDQGPPSERTIAAALEKVPEFRQLEESSDPRIRQLVKYAAVLEGSPRHTGVHAAGVIIAPGDVSDYVPLAIQKGKTQDEDVVVTQYEGSLIEAFGLLKMDFLGLRTLTILDDAIDLIRETQGTDIDIEAIPLDDQKTFELFQRGETVAIFQFESEKMREYMRELKPTSVDDLIAMNALYRPGPMKMIPDYIACKHGRKEVVYSHPMLQSILEPTYGTPIYQEQVMQMAQIMGGFTLGAADELRRAMGKKKMDVMERQRSVFVAGAADNGVPEEDASRVFDIMAEFAGYGFNKSHSAAYSILAYQTGYLKAHYPAEFMSAVLRSEMGDTKKLAATLAETQRMGLEVLPPSINRSQVHFTVDNGRVRFGLAAIRGVGVVAIEKILEARSRVGAFKSLHQLCRQIDLRMVNKKVLECLAGAGAFDDFEGHRAQLVASIDDAVRHALRLQADEAAGQHSLFGGGPSAAGEAEPPLVHVDRWSRSETLRRERDLLGFYVSGHPLDAFSPEVRAFATARLGEPESVDPGKTQRVCGIITAVQRRTSRSGRPMAFVTLEDITGQGEVICFGPPFEKHQHLLQVDELVMVIGEPSFESGAFKIRANEILPMQHVRDKLVESIVLRVDSRLADEGTMKSLRALCDRNRGKCKLYFEVQADGLSRPVRLRSRSFMVDPSPELMQGIARLFGQSNIVLEGAN